MVSQHMDIAVLKLYTIFPMVSQHMDIAARTLLEHEAEGHMLCSLKSMRTWAAMP